MPEAPPSDRHRRRRRTAAFVAALTALAVVPALAGIPLRNDLGNPVRWSLDVEQPNVRDGVLYWYLDPRGSIEEPPGDVTERDALHAALASWEDAKGSSIRFGEERSRWAVDADADDRINYIGWKRFRLGALTLAASISTHSNGVLKDVDIIFNDTKEIVRWSTADTGILAMADVQAVAAHELGHLIGLDHSPAGNATMHFIQRVGSVSTRTLTPDDVGSLVQAYPGPVDPTRGEIIGTVTVGKRKRKRGIPVFALNARTGDVAGSALTDEEGYYRIPALPPAPYRLVAAPLATRSPYSDFWESAPTRLLPAWHVEELPDGRRVPAVVNTRAGFPEIGRDIRVDRPKRRYLREPDDDFEDARVIRMGETISGLFENELDADWVRVEGVDRTVDVRIRSWAIGSEVDPEIGVTRSNGLFIGTMIDRRPPADPEFAHGPLGVDLDAEILEVAPPEDGVLLVRVRAQPQSETGHHGSYWTLTVLPAVGAPDARRSTAAFTPGFVRSGVPEATALSVRPRDGNGDPITDPGTVVTARFPDGRGDVVLEPFDEGEWRLVIDGPPAPGTIDVTVEVAGDLGTVVIDEPARLVTAGAADASLTRLTADRRRTDADGESTVTLILEPVDSEGRRLGTGLDVAIVYDELVAGTLGPVEDRGDGTYAALLTAPEEPGRARFRATVAGSGSGNTVDVGFGWDLALVAADLGVDVGRRLGLPAATGAVRKRLEHAAAALEDALDLVSSGDELGVAKRTAKSIKALERAAHADALPDADALVAELAEAMRRRVTGTINSVVFPVPDPKGEVLRGQAWGFALRAAEELDDGDTRKGVALLVRTAKIVRRLEKRLP